MRVTTQMLNESARKAGLPVNNTSLLNYINSDSSKNTLLSALNKNTSPADTVKKSRYEKLEKEADQLLQKAEVFTDESGNSVFAKARKSGNSQEIYDSAKAFVEQYNSVAAALKSTSGTLNDYYRQMLSEVTSENYEGLKKIGITFAQNGTLGIDEEKLKATDIDTLEQVLGSANSFSSKVAFLASHISDNAQTNLESLSSQYSSAGTSYSALANKYNFWG